MTLGVRPQEVRVLLLEGIHPAAVEMLKDTKFIVETVKKALSPQELIEQASGFHALGIRSKTQVPGAVIEKLNELLVLGAFCIGTDQVDLESSNRRGIPVFNAPYSNTRSVAELVIGELVMLSRHLGDRNTLAHQGIWEKSAQGARELRGKTLGIVGYGHIGTQVSIMAEAMGLRVVYYDIVRKLPLGNAHALESLSDLLGRSDFVTLHVPDTPLTRGMIGPTEINMMKRGASLLNASRGTVVDIKALAAALDSGYLAGAAVDVFPKEPSHNDEKFQTELQGLKNVILTPHIGGSTEEAQENIGREVAQSLIHYLTLGTTIGAVNFPNIDLVAMGDFQRILNVHKNVPGVLSAITKIVSEVGANIQRQYLSTDSHIGYLIMDVEGGRAEPIANKISELSTSIKTRIVH